MIAKFVAAAVLACASISAQALVLVDQSPDTIGFSSVGTFANTAQGQNFLIKFTVGAGTTLTGFDIYSACNALGCPPISVGTAVVVKFAADVAGAPDFAGLASYATTLTAVDSLGSTANPRIQRYHADVTLPVAAGDYWFGMSGDNLELGLQYGPGAAPLYLLVGDSNFGSLSGNYAVAYNVYAGEVPEPATWALMIMGFGMTGYAMRRRRVALAA